MTVYLGKEGDGVAQVVQAALVVRWCNSNSHLLLQVVLYDSAAVVVVVVVVVGGGGGIDQVLSCQS